MKNLNYLFLVLFFSGCVDEGVKDPVFTIETNAECRVQVRRIAVFKDDIAYDDCRGVYLITDAKTGKEFIGISGIGISELGAHSSDDSTVRDER